MRRNDQVTDTPITSLSFQRNKARCGNTQKHLADALAGVQEVGYVVSARHPAHSRCIIHAPCAVDDERGVDHVLSCSRCGVVARICRPVTSAGGSRSPALLHVPACWPTQLCKHIARRSCARQIGARQTGNSGKLGNTSTGEYIKARSGTG